jgi:hypothetical protein
VEGRPFFVSINYFIPMGRADEEINLKLTLSNGKTVQTQIDAVGDEMEDMADSAEKAGRDGAESMDRMGDSAQEASDDVEQASRDMDRAAQSADRFGGASNNASELLFTLGDSAQDARYGLEGVGNNLGMAAEQASLMVNQAGDTRTAMQALAGAIVGPAGVVLAIQGLIALGPEIVDFFEGSEEATKDWKDTMDGAADDMFKIAEEVESFKVATVQQAQTVQKELESNREEVEKTLDVLEQLEGRSGAARTRRLRNMQRSGDEQVQNLIQELDLQEASQEEIREKLEAQRRYQNELDESLSSVQKKIANLKVEKGIEDVLAETSAERAENEEEAAEGIADQVKNMEALKAASLDLATTVGKRLQQARQEHLRGEEIIRSIRRREGREEGRENAGAVSEDQIDRLEPMDTGIDAGDFETDSIREVNAAIGSLQRELDGLDNGEFKQQVRSTIGELKKMRDEMMKGSRAAELVGDALETSIETAIVSVAKSAATGKSVFAAIAQTLGSLLTRLGKIAIATSIGIEAIRTSLRTLNPFVAAAAGAALVALGTTIKSQVADLAKSGGGGGGTGASPTGSGGGPDIEGGGEARADVPGTETPPSFKKGVDNFGGGLARVHEDELVALPPASNVITNKNARAISGAMGVLSQTDGAAGGGGAAQDLNVQAEQSLSVDIGDGFRLVERLDRIRSDRENLVGGE